MIEQQQQPGSHSVHSVQGTRLVIKCFKRREVSGKRIRYSLHDRWNPKSDLLFRRGGGDEVNGSVTEIAIKRFV